MRQVDLSIIIPAKNEGKRLGKTLNELSAYLKKTNLGMVEVLVVADGEDNTVEVADSKRPLFDAYKVLKDIQKPGKGAAVKYAMLKASGQYRLFMDADLATPLHHLETLQKHINSGSDVIIGVRNLSSSHTGLRKFISNFGNFLVRLLLGLKIHDTQCGFKAFRADVAKDVFDKQRILGWGFDMEVLAIARSRGNTIQAIAINDWRDVAGGTFNNVAVAGAISTFKDLLKIKWNLISGKYRR